MLVAALGLVLWGVPLSESVKADLNSPVYAVREKARDVLRAAFVPTDSTKWNGLRALLQHAKGHSASEVFDAMWEDFGVQIGPLPEFDRFCTLQSRLDADWLIVCSFDHGVLVGASLRLQPPAVNPTPPPGYTGLWRIYREDGSIDSTIYYMHGKPGGPLGDDGGREIPGPP